jgi:hypothetical protein
MRSCGGSKLQARAPGMIVNDTPEGKHYAEVGPGLAIRLRISNQPVGRSETCIARNVLARISYYGVHNRQRIETLDGRWADSPQMADRDRALDYVVNNLTVDFPIGVSRSLDIAVRMGGRPCIPINNDNFVNGPGNLEIAGRPYLDGPIKVVVQLDGIQVNTTVQFSFNCDDFAVESPPVLVDNLASLKSLSG